MKKTAKDKDYEYLETSPEMKASGLRRITRPRSLDGILNSPGGRQSKERISIHLDVEVIDFFKEQAEKTGTGYQTLINRDLRRIADESRLPPIEELKQEILHDKEFLSELREVLSV